MANLAVQKCVSEKGRSELKIQFTSTPLFSFAMTDRASLLVYWAWPSLRWAG